MKNCFYLIAFTALSINISYSLHRATNSIDLNDSASVVFYRTKGVFWSSFAERKTFMKVEEKGKWELSLLQKETKSIKLDTGELVLHNNLEKSRRIKFIL
jgi:hypothetical protein